MKLGERLRDEEEQTLVYDLKRGEISKIEDNDDRNTLRTYVTPEGETVVGLLAAQPFQDRDEPLNGDTTWWFEVKEEDIPESWRQSVTINGEPHDSLKLDAVEDLGILCHYSIAESDQSATAGTKSLQGLASNQSAAVCGKPAETLPSFGAGSLSVQRSRNREGMIWTDRV